MFKDFGYHFLVPKSSGCWSKIFRNRVLFIQSSLTKKHYLKVLMLGWGEGIRTTSAITSLFQGSLYGSLVRKPYQVYLLLTNILYFGKVIS